jgi:hypothetical protein
LDKKDKLFSSFNGDPPHNSLVNGKIITIVGKRGTPSHRNKFEMNFEYSFFKPFWDD